MNVPLTSSFRRARKFAGKPHISSKDGGHTLNLNQFASEGVTLVGRILGVDGTQVKLARDLHENLAKADQFEADLISQIDSYIERNGLKIPEEVLPQLASGEIHWPGIA